VLDEDHRAVGPWDPKLDPDTLRKILRDMVLVRIFDDRMYRAQRQGKTSFYMKCTGEEAIAITAAAALDRDDMNFPTYRQQGLLIARGYPLVEMMCQIYSNKGDKLRGRQLPIMYSDKAHGFFTISGNLGTQFPQAVGWAMAIGDQGRQPDRGRLDRRRRDGRRRLPRRNDLRAVYNAPAILRVVNNQWAISSFSGIAGAEKATFAQRAIGYGMPGLRVDGNDALASIRQSLGGRPRALQPRPTLIEFFTYRAEGHSTSDDPSGYRPAGEAKAWPLGDPIERLKAHLIALGEWDEERHEALEPNATPRSAPPRRKPRSSESFPSRARTISRACSTTSMPRSLEPRRAARRGRRRGSRLMPAMNMIQALNSAHRVAMERDPDVVVYGEDVGYFGGVFRVTEGLQKEFGKERCFDAPISEGGIVATAVGMAAYGLKPVIEIQFADYIYPGYDQIVSEVAKIRYRTAGEWPMPMVIRSPYGGGIFGGQTHSQSPESLFTHIAGLKTVIPSTPYDAKGLLIAAIEDPTR
jgi:2-oxoisovalerate dehydrogenase E1 component alpha subunit